ncbi:hypothetical protein [Phenylobacterium sp.]|jgi:hypothetical protein|uniref:hypothetical protein n=1 Tax=Phenylobacterium sp. TaxID=1871053 RepID=UPI002F4134D3
MSMYTFHLCNQDGGSPSFEAFELPDDGATFIKAGNLLDQHLSCDHVEVWQDARAVLALHREQPVIRPIPALA